MSHLANLQAFFEQNGNYGEACCGQKSHLWSAALEGGESAARLPALLSDAAAAARIRDWSEDETVPARLKAFALTLGGRYPEATEQFTATRYKGEVPPPQLTHDPKWLEQLEAVGAPLPPLDTPAGWMVFDVLWHLQMARQKQLLEAKQPIEGKWIDPPLAREEVPILFDGLADGQLAKCVVEVLPGPAGLVTPDWWGMGLIHFPSGRKGRALDNFVASTQRILSAVWKGNGDRLRWRLEPWKRGPMPTVVHGRSAEAAVAGAALSVGYSRSPTESVEAGLNPTLGITATVRESDRPWKQWELGKVADDGIENKLRAAVGQLSEVLVHTGQGPEKFPQVLPHHRVGNLGDAYFEMQLTNKFIRNHQERMYAPFNRDNPERKWDMEKPT